MNAEAEELLNRQRIREVIRSALKHERLVNEWIEAVEKRLGREAEQPMDAAVIVFLVHKLKNLGCVTCLKEEYGA